MLIQVQENALDKGTDGRTDGRADERADRLYFVERFRLPPEVQKEKKKNEK